MMHKVEGHTALFKDPETGVVVNTDSRGLKAAKEAKRRVIQEMEEKESLKQRIDNLEKMLHQLIEDKNG